MKKALKKNKLGRCLVTGGSGMLGTAAVKLLADEGYPIRVLDIKPFPGCAAIEYLKGDVRNRHDVDRACDGVDTVFHMAAEVWNPRVPAARFDEVNIHGTRNIIAACIKNGVTRLVNTSSIDVVIHGMKPIVYGDESLPYPENGHSDHYSRTKMESEIEVISSNGKNGISTCSLRPAGIYGPGDRYHLPGLVEAARSGFNIRLGDGSACFSHVYSGNAAHAHVMAAKNLYPGSPVAGQCYFITDHYPASNFFTFLEPFLACLEIPPARKSIPFKLAYAMAWIAERIYPRSTFCTFAVMQTCVDHTFIHEKAKRDFGYEPIYSLDDAFRETVEWLVRNYSGDAIVPVS
ncbi:MAG: NAD-dependent epimerase/dehydratase family protein [Spirochaetes bacterium]|jgi:nucleoside-diphosphate-sugar epimerase|nr:NAD-dependent epimerase/dehydratase family protein [Spirochaetota bacterium]